MTEQNHKKSYSMCIIYSLKSQSTTISRKQRSLTTSRTSITSSLSRSVESLLAMRRQHVIHIALIHIELLILKRETGNDIAHGKTQPFSHLHVDQSSAILMHEPININRYIHKYTGRQHRHKSGNISKKLRVVRFTSILWKS